MVVLPTLTAWGEALAALPLSALLRASAWGYPAVEVVHLLGLALLFGSIVVVDLRLLGLWRNLPVVTLLPAVLPLTVAGFVAAAASGALLVLAHADELTTNPALLVKLGLIALGLLNAAWFHLRPYRQLLRRGGNGHSPSAEPAAQTASRSRHWNIEAPPPALARCSAVVSLLIWTAVITAGRLIAYV